VPLDQPVNTSQTSPVLDDSSYTERRERILDAIRAAGA
jgi:hypothetical protein